MTSASAGHADLRVRADRGDLPVWVATYLAYGYPRRRRSRRDYQVITVVGLAVLARTRRFGVFRTTQLLVPRFPALLQASLGGFVASSAMILWAIFTPLAALALLGLRARCGGSRRSSSSCGARAARPPARAAPGCAPDGLSSIMFFVLNVLGPRCART